MPCIIISNSLVYFFVSIEYFGQKIQKENIHVCEKRVYYDAMTCSEDYLKRAMKEMLYLRPKAW